MNWSSWIRANYEDVRRVVRTTGWRNSVRWWDMDDFTSRVILRLLTSAPPRGVDEQRWRYVQVVAKRQAVDDTRRRLARPVTVPIEDNDWAAPPAYEELEVLDEVGRLGQRDAKAVLGHALGLRDHELAEDGVSHDAVSQRRRRARGRMAA